jgi:16S rRNA (adenine1518-N6/adenine1519-N6)-dimethyltransferase
MTHRTKKSLGQHFLRSTSAVRAIVASGNTTNSDIVLEIGPGEGVLTVALLATGAKIIAVEKDADLIPILTERFAQEIASGQLTLLHMDVLDFSPKNYGLEKGEYKLIANIPYYITGAIMEQFLENEYPPSCIVVLIQKEVAQRAVSRDGKESILSISVKAFGTPRITAKVPASAFRPAPKVDSAVLTIENISTLKFSDNGATPEEIRHFFSIVRAGFAHKRKLLMRNLEEVAKRREIEQAFSELSLSPLTRAETVPVETWIELAKKL